MGLRTRHAALLGLLAVAPVASVLGASAGGGNPTSTFSTFLGGSGADSIRAVAQGAGGTWVVVGSTTSVDFPVQAALQTSSGGGSDAFVARVAADGKTVLWATYLGGSGEDEARAVAVASDGSLWVGGSTTSTDFPLSQPLQAENGGDETGFLAHLSADGATLLSSTYLGGSGADRVNAVVVDGGDSPWAIGGTDSTDLATTYDALFTYPVGGSDAFAVRLSSDGTGLLYASYLGGSGSDEALAAAFDSAGAVVITGRTDSTDFPVTSEWQSESHGGTDMFLLVLGDFDGALRSASVIGGEGNEEGTTVAVQSGSVYVIGGRTDSPDFPNSAGLSPAFMGGTDGFLAITGPTGASLAYTALLGGSGDDAILGVVTSPNGSMVLTGSTSSADFPVRAAGQPFLAGGTDGFVTRALPYGGGFTYSSYFGGSGDDAILGAVLDGTGALRVAGSTGSTDFPLRSPLQGIPGGSGDGFLAAALTAPAVPASFRATAVFHDSIALAWEDPTEGRAVFSLERRTGTAAWTALANLPEDTTSFVDATVAPTTNYSYRLRLSLEGDSSSWTNTLVVTTPQVPVPLAPASVTAEVLTPHSVRILWEDRSWNEITYEVFRSVDGGAFEFLQTLPSGTTETVDATAAPDRSLYYAVRAVGVSGPSSLAISGLAATPATLVVSLESGMLKDSPKSVGDSLALVAHLPPGGGGALDPVVDGMRISLGGVKEAWALDLAPHAEGWKVKKGTWTWKSPRTSRAKATLVFDPATGVLKLKVKKIDLAGSVAAGDLRFAVRCGGDAGSCTDAWTEAKPGRFALQPRE